MRKHRHFETVLATGLSNAIGKEVEVELGWENFIDELHRCSGLRLVHSRVLDEQRVPSCVRSMLERGFYRALVIRHGSLI